MCACQRQVKKFYDFHHNIIVSFCIFQCSVRVCQGLVQENRDHVQRYRLKYGLPGTVHNCYYDINSLAPRGAVFHQRIHWTLAFHVIFWPGISFLFGVILCASVCYSRRCKKKKYGMRNSRGGERFWQQPAAVYHSSQNRRENVWRQFGTTERSIV